MLKKYLKQHPEPTLGSIYYCGTQQIKQVGMQPATFVLSNGQSSQLFGIQTCHSSWACPRCTALQMAKYGNRIACAIDALKTWHKQSAFMMTFTIPHSKYFKAKTLFEILIQTWKRFVHAGNHKARLDKTRKNKQLHGNDPYGAFREQLDIRYHVRIYEFTWSEQNGWHPHIHALFWVPDTNWDKVLNYEQSLQDRWWECARQSTIAVLSKLNTSDEDRKHVPDRVNKFYADWRKNPKTGHRSAYFSKDKSGALTRQKSSYYISGKSWTGDKEVSSGYNKLAREGDFSPYQLLVEANRNPQQRDKYLKLYVEYAVATRGKRRIQFSKSNINQIVTKWKLTQSYTESLKKKFTERVAEKYRVVCWFTEQQWLRICHLDSELPIISQILALAKKPDGKKLIEYLLLQYDVDIGNNPSHRYESFIENILNPIADDVA